MTHKKNISDYVDNKQQMIIIIREKLRTLKFNRHKMIICTIIDMFLCHCYVSS